MEREELRLSEALLEHRTWESDGVAVLCASISLPQLAGNSRRARRFNSYYRRLCRAYLAYCARMLAAEAAESCRAAMAVSAPWRAARAELNWRVSLRAGDLLSIVCDARESIHGMPPYLLRRAEVWDLSTALPMPLCEFFPPHAHVRRDLLRFARAEAAHNADASTAYRENWRAMLRRSYNPRCFYLTDDGLCIFYPLGSVADAKEGIVAFTMPYDEENGPFLPPQA